MLGQMVHRPFRKDQRQQIESSLITSCGQGSLDALYGVLAEQGSLDELYGDLAELTNLIHSCALYSGRGRSVLRNACLGNGARLRLPLCSSAVQRVAHAAIKRLRRSNSSDRA